MEKEVIWEPSCALITRSFGDIMASMKILYEDDYIIAYHKPAGLATQTKKIGEKDLFSEAKKHVNGGYIGIINRLDQPVEGIVLLAKDSKTAAALENQIQKHMMQKHYRAEAYTPNEAPQVNIMHNLTDYMIKDAKTNTSKICSESTNGAKRAELEYSVEEVREKTAILDIHLLTGRHHQIRLQFSNAGYPLLGDKKYGTKESIEYSVEQGVKYVALCAYKLCFNHPITKKEVRIEIERNI